MPTKWSYNRSKKSPRKSKKPPIKKSQGRGRSQDSIASAIGRGAAKGCGSGCSKALPIVLISTVYFCSNLTLAVTSVKDFFIRLIREYQLGYRLNCVLIAVFIHPAQTMLLTQ